MQGRTDIDSTLKRILFGPQLGAMLSSILDLNIPQLLSSGPKTVDELAQTTKTIKSKLERVLFALSVKKLFDYVPETKQFKINPVSEILLNPDFANSVRLDLEPWMFDFLSAVPECLKQNKTSPEIVYNMTFNDFLAQNPDYLNQFVIGVSGYLNTVSDRVMRAIDLRNVDKVLEIGGYGGELSISLAKSYHNFKGTIYDQIYYREIIEKKIHDNQLSERIKTEIGDYVTAVPGGYDVVLMTWVSARYNDKNFDKILRNVRNSLHPGSKIYIVEPLMSRSDHMYSMEKYLDMIWWYMVDGKIRSKEELGCFLDANWFKILNVTQAMPYFIVEAAVV